MIHAVDTEISSYDLFGKCVPLQAVPAVLDSRVFCEALTVWKSLALLKNSTSKLTA